MCRCGMLYLLFIAVPAVAQEQDPWPPDWLDGAWAVAIQTPNGDGKRVDTTRAFVFIENHIYMVGSSLFPLRVLASECTEEANYCLCRNDGRETSCRVKIYSQGREDRVVVELDYVQFKTHFITSYTLVPMEIDRLETLVDHLLKQRGILGARRPDYLPEEAEELLVTWLDEQPRKPRSLGFLQVVLETPAAPVDALIRRRLDSDQSTGVMKPTDRVLMVHP